MIDEASSSRQSSDARLRARLSVDGSSSESLKLPKSTRDARHAAQAAVEHIGMGWSQFETLMLAGGVFAMEGMVLIIAGIIARTLEAKWDQHLGHTTALVTCLFLGVTVGTIVGGMASDSHGRRPVILTCYAGSTATIFVSCLGMHWAYLAVTNAFLGFFFGYGVPASNTLISECCPVDYRANLVCSAAILFAVGQLVAAFIIWAVSPYLEYETLDWRLMVFLSGMLPTVLWPITWWRLRESAMWQLTTGQTKAALATLEFSAKQNGTEIPEEHVRSMLSAEDTPMAPSTSWNPFAPGDGSHSPRNGSHSPRNRRLCGLDCCPGLCPGATWGYDVGARIQSGWEFWEKRVAVLFRPQYRSVCVIMTWVCFCSNFCYYGMIYTLPETFVEVLVMLEGKTDQMHLSPALSLMIASLFEIPGVLMAIVLSLTVARRWTLVIAFSVTSIAAVCLVSASKHDNEHTFMLTSLAAFTGKLFVAACFILVYLYLLEVYPTHIRATGLAFSMSLGRFGAFVIPFLAESLMLWTDSTFHVFVCIGVVACGGALTCLFLPRETKDQPLPSAETPLMAKR